MNIAVERMQALTIVLSGIILALAGSVCSPISPRREFYGWVALNVCTGFLLPRAILKAMHHPLPSYGFGAKQRETAVWLILGLPSAVMIAFIAVRLPGFRTVYPIEPHARAGGPAFAMYLFASVVYMFAWEFLFRGYLTLALERHLAWVALPLQAALFGLTHAAKLPPEFLAAFGGGVVQGLIAMRTKSVLVPFVLHGTLFATWNILSMLPGTGGY